MADELLSVQVKHGDRKAWQTVRKAIIGRGTITGAAKSLGVSRRCLTYWLAKVDGLREFVEDGK